MVALKPKAESIYQMKVTLQHVRPPVWRRIQISGDVSLHRLHLALQTTTGWSNSHLYSFEIGDTAFSVHDPDNPWGIPMKDAKKARLGGLIRNEGLRLRYLYDFGDGWEHEVLVEKMLPAVPPLQYPVCLAGKRRCPPEDCGGPWGYADFLKAIRDRKHPEHKRMLEWIGGRFDPEAFDLDGINMLLKSGRNFGALGW